MSWLERWPDDWRLHAFRVIDDIPSGCLASYGAIAAMVNARTGHSIIARNVAWLRSELYGWVRGGDEDIRKLNLPLHRVAKAGDAKACGDSPETRADCRDRRERENEGFATNPRWWTG